MKAGTLLKLALPAALLIAAAVIYPVLNPGMQLPDEVRAHHLFAAFEAQFDGRPLNGGICDLNDDGLEDLLVIYRENREQNKFVVILAGDPPTITVPDPAPLENAAIEFKDIDKTPPMEFIISGNKGSYMGYGIYRIKEEALYNLFDADMEHCC